jgi:hypothetical protein
MHAFEGARRADARFLEVPVQDHAFGADPYDLVALRDGRVAGVLRGTDAVVVLDDQLREIARAAAPRSPSGIAVYRGPRAGDFEPGDLLVTSEIEPVLAHYRPSAVGGQERQAGQAARIERHANVDLGDAFGVRDVATGPEGVAYVVEEHDGRLLTVGLGAPGRGVDRRVQQLPRGPLRVVRTRGALFVSTLLDHSISAFRVDARGRVAEAAATARLDGPFWGLDAIAVGPDAEDALILAGGAEDRPLDRKGGFFGNVDSYVYVYRWKAKAGELSRIAEINVGEHGLIVPKGLAFASDDGAKTTAVVTSYGGAVALRLTWNDGLDQPPAVRPLPFVPGTSALLATPTGFLAADPLLDAWVVLDPKDDVRVVHVESPSDTRGDRERLGEALFFTGLMAPTSSAEGAKSRFSCETCHFEGYVDGRTHHTGRGDIHATTKPLVGLFNNRPHFSRALDPDLSAVAENEFRVAGAPSPADPHFDVDAKDVPWIAHLGLTKTHYAPTELRLSLMSFLMKWTHRTNPRAAVARPFSSEERSGALAFKERCERCHEARAAADEPTTRVPFERWESFILGGGGPIVWASDAYEKTGIVPYVHEQGARVPSLRRIYKKRPYFTNGTAPDVMSVLRSARWSGTTFSHAGGADGDRLDEPTARAIAAFVDLL